MTDLPKLYDPTSIEPRVTERWLDAKAFAATPDDREQRYVIMMPLPNVTGALHMGHAMDNVMQDLLIRWHRMQGDNSLWMAGTDHAGIGTQAVVEKRLYELEGKTRLDVGRDELVRRIWEWKDQYQQRIVGQQQAMGCSCDWDRQRFTMDAVCARAVRHTFFKMFRDGLIYQGHRLVNWDCHLATAVADDEVYKTEVQGNFWHFRYPVIDPADGEPTHIVVATTRPETMLGDTAVACHPDPAAALDAELEQTRERLAAAPARDKAAIEQELERLEERKTTHLPALMTIAAMARDGRQVMLPLQDRPIPLICDEWAKPTLGSGCVKITPGHDPNDYDVWQRHRDEIAVENILEPDGTLNKNAGDYAGLDRFEARKQVVAALEGLGLVEEIEDRAIEIDHSDRSKTIIEPYLSKQWFVHMADVEGGVKMGAGTAHEFTSPGLAQAAIDAVGGAWKSATGRQVAFHPDERYGRTYTAWLAEKRDWCISRQLWWGHQIPVWSGTLTRDQMLNVEGLVLPALSRDDVCAWVVLPDERRVTPNEAFDLCRDDEDLGDVTVQICFRDEDTELELAPTVESVNMVRDPDVLDTWFSSAVWPHSTLGWPDPATASIDEGQAELGEGDGRADCLSYYYPGSCLVTGRDIITLWVARMVIMGLYNIGDVPFTDVFIHANIQDGKGERMSKSRGNGIDPVDMIDRYGADAMRYVLCEMQTGTQDVRLPVAVDSPFTGEPIDLSTAKHGRTIFSYLCPQSGKEFDVLGTIDDLPAAKPYSERFEVGRNFCNKLWNSARFAFMNLQDVPFEPRDHQELPWEDRWILSRLAATRDEVQRQFEAYNPSAALSAAREFFWSEFCDGYLEIVKPRMRDEARAGLARQVLAAVLDSTLRLMHPMMPFVTETLWQTLSEVAPRRGVDQELEGSELLVHAAWPAARPDWRDEDAEARIAVAREVVSTIREMKARHQVPAAEKIDVILVPSGDPSTLEPVLDLIGHLAATSSLQLTSDAPGARDAATAAVAGVQVWALGIVDVESERKKLEAEHDKLVKRMAGTARKLDNEGFVAKAPPEIVERERKNLESMEGERKNLESRLAELG